MRCISLQLGETTTHIVQFDCFSISSVSSLPFLPFKPYICLHLTRRIVSRIICGPSIGLLEAKAHGPTARTSRPSLSAAYRPIWIATQISSYYRRSLSFVADDRSSPSQYGDTVKPLRSRTFQIHDLADLRRRRQHSSLCMSHLDVIHFHMPPCRTWWLPQFWQCKYPFPLTVTNVLQTMGIVESFVGHAFCF